MFDTLIVLPEVFVEKLIWKKSADGNKSMQKIKTLSIILGRYGLTFHINLPDHSHIIHLIRRIPVIRISDQAPRL